MLDCPDILAGLAGLLRAAALAVVLAAGPVWGAAATDLDLRLQGLLSGPLPTMSELARLVARSAHGERLIVRAVGLEIAGLTNERIASLAPLIDDHREAAAAQPALTCSLADAYALAGAPEKAARTLALLDEARLSDLDRIDISTVRSRLEQAARRLSEARQLQQGAVAALRAAVPDAAYENWRSHLLRRRLNRLGADLERLAAVDQAGPAYWAWLQADRQRSLAAYLAVAKEHAASVFADAAVMEAARVHARAGDPHEGVRLLATMPRILQGPLAVPALLLQGDLMLQLRRANAGREAYEKALSLLARPEALPVEFTPAVRAAVTSAQPLHRLGGWSYPEWSLRPVGCLLAPALDPLITAHQRYQAVVRLATLAFAEGNLPAATMLARSLIAIDDIDREMEQQQRGPGGLVLAHTFASGEFLFPLDAFKEVPSDVLPCILMAVACYQVYDWEQARGWLDIAEPMIPAGKRQARTGMQALRACSLQMLGERQQAVEVARGVKLRPGDRPHQAWFIARQVEWEIHQHAPEDFTDAMAVMQTVRDEAPNTVFARDALLFQSGYAMAHDLPLARKLTLAFRSAYPDVFREAIADQLAEIEQRLNAQGQP